ncbi:divergent polysaccharide deacetylase family protein [Roseivivax sp. GX 12232]|uniref:divergent polysaccharide deacetylase family protein n=1 Tax=Roseivivax sp. GX 12232 TaxID=2900547 RepID=UPI001E41E9CD|nr:divergent polysaccharide deacetylase family protein [Roseivivax sp. GX 12232]MCE0507133.1 divergent polysaccharide deacetylase family protein [Roseivivax sp. GX 12232]
MARGFLAGTMTGVVIAAGGAAVLSLTQSYPEPPAGLMPEPQVAGEDREAGAAPEPGQAGAEAPGADAAPAPGRSSGGLVAPAPDAPLADGADRRSAAAPEVTAPAEGLSEAPEPGAAGPVAPGADAPVSAAPGSAGLEAPASERAPEAAEAPAEPPRPEVSDGEAGFAAAPSEGAAPDQPVTGDAPRAAPGPESLPTQSPDSGPAPETQSAEAPARGAAPEAGSAPDMEVALADPTRADEAAPEGDGMALAAPEGADVVPEAPEGAMVEAGDGSEAASDDVEGSSSGPTADSAKGGDAGETASAGSAAEDSAADSGQPADPATNEDASETGVSATQESATQESSTQTTRPPDAMAAAPEDAPEAPSAETTPPERPAPAPQAQDEVAVLSPPDSEAGRPQVGRPATSPTERADAARSTRLPRIGETPEDSTPAPEETPASAAEGAKGLDPDAPPYQRYAVAHEAEAGQPRLAVILMDPGTGPLGPAALEAFPFPLSFAVDPTAPDAAARMRGYRERGFEVLALTALPEGAAARDVEVTLEAALGALPEVVGVLEAPEGGLQGSRDVSEQVADYLAASGHALVMQGQGLNTATDLARRGGVPAGAVFRDFDGDGQDPTMQRRMLDRVALRARQDGAVIALGRLTADTVSALLLWGLQDRTNDLALVPVSAVLAAQGE